MATTHASLDAAAQERKARLAKLQSLKRKQPSSEREDSESGPTIVNQDGPLDVTTTFLSGRNYDPTSRGPKLGFENGPAENQETLEKRARDINDEIVKQAEEQEKEDKPIDLFKLQPKKPNWDLKRDVEHKLERLNVQTDNAIARLVKERIATQKEKQVSAADSKVVAGVDEGDTVGLQGEELVGGIHLREQEEAEDEIRDREDYEDDHL